MHRGNRYNPARSESMDVTRGETSTGSLTPTMLETALRRVDDSVLLVRPRILRRVIKRARSVRGALGQVPHRKAFVIDGAELLRYAARWELGLPRDRTLPPRVILLVRPTQDRLQQLTPDQALVRWWRLLFHSRIHEALEGPGVTRLTQAEVNARVDAIGQTVFDEIRSVLAEEGLLFETRNDHDEYVEFVASFLEMSAFAPRLLSRYFPGIAKEADRLAAIVADDVDAAAVLEATRPPNAPDPQETATVEEERPGKARRGRRATRRRSRVGSARRYLQVADRKSDRGNQVRAAILRQRAAEPAAEDPAGIPETFDHDAAQEIEKLIRRLKSAPALDAGAERSWNELVRGMLPRAAIGVFSPEARFLYDVQRVCVDHERGVDTIDVVEWVRSLGRRPIRRSLPHQREVLMCRHLRLAEKRLVQVHLPEEDRARLRTLVRAAHTAAEARLRKRCRPEIVRLLTEAGIVPDCLPEEVARDKLVEELLDRVAERGFLSLSDVRDAISRNQIKLVDCTGAADVWSANRLLRVDEELGVALDGVYRRGEVYLRWLQRASSLVFGTKTGRAFARYVAIPFGGAFVVLSGLGHMISLATEATLGFPVHLIDPYLVSVVLLGLYLNALLYMEEVRAGTVAVLKMAGRGLKFIFWTLPRHVMSLEAVRAFIRSRLFRLAMRFVLKPALGTGIVAILLVFLDLDAAAWTWTLIGTFVGFQLVLNSPVGTAVEEVGTEWVWRLWDRVRGTLIVGLVRFLLYIFRWFTEMLERALYTVDEWLRFRTGESEVTFFVKAVLGVVWFAVTWIMRVYVNLLLEPQVNPVKHFPVVTVAHKLMVGFLPALIAFGNELLTPPLGAVIANAITWSTVTLLPGFFGFLVWEFKENWKLYAANRSRRLEPVLVGGHGETVIRLMRPGFHSGTLPKAYARLRRAERKSQWTGEVIRARRQREVIHHVEQDVMIWVQRELVALLAATRGWAGNEVHVGHVTAGSNALHVPLISESDGPTPLVLGFEAQSGLLVASVLERGWLDAPPDRRRAVLRDAIAGLYKTAGVDIVREALEQALGDDPPPYDVADQGLVVWPGPGYEVEETRSLHSHLYTRHPVTWQSWIDLWQADRTGARGPVITSDVRLLPPPAAADG